MSIAGKFLAFDANGLPIAADGTGADAGLRTDLASSIGGALVKLTTGRTVEQKAGDLWSVKDFGAIGDGTTDDAAAFGDALARGVGVLLPSGTYKLNTGLVLTDPVNLHGETAPRRSSMPAGLLRDRPSRSRRGV